jgi:mono/diheme cytochrome c family protein
MSIRSAFSAAAILTLAVLALAGCDRLPGRPGAREEVVRPEQVLDFNTLYKENCSGCHGADGKGGASIALRNPVFLAIADDATIQNIAAAGVAGTQMTPFAQSKGGMLTDQQIDVLVKGIRGWASADVPRERLPREWGVSRAGKRSISANRGHRGTSGVGCAGLAKQRGGPAYDLGGNFGCGRMAGIA